MELLDLGRSNTVVWIVFDVHIFIITYISLPTRQYILKFFKVIFQLIFHSLHIFSFSDFVTVKRKVTQNISISFTSSMLTRWSLIRSLVRYDFLLNILWTLQIRTLFTDIFVRRRSHNFLGKRLSLIYLVLVNLLLILLKYLVVAFYLLLIWKNILTLVCTLLMLMIIILMMLRCHFDISNIIIIKYDQI